MSSSRLIGTSFVEQFGLHFHKRSVDTSGKCNIAAPGGGVYFAIYELSLADKKTLDEIEGVGRGYRDTAIDVPRFGDCAVYVAEDGYKDDALRPFDWYHEFVMLGCHHLGFPEEYTARIAAIDSIPDPDPSRRKKNESLIERIRRSV